MRPHLHIIILAYLNHKAKLKTLTATLSVLTSYPSCHLYVNLDPTSSPPLITQLTQKFPSVNFFHLPFKGYAYVINSIYQQISLNLTPHDYVGIINDDIYLKSCQPLIDFITSQTNSDVIWPIVIENHTLITGTTLNPFLHRALPISHTPNLGPHGPIFFIKNATINKLIAQTSHFFNPTFDFFWEDIDLNLRLNLIKAKKTLISNWQVKHLHSQTIKHQSPKAKYYYYLNMLKFWYIWSSPFKFFLYHVPFILINQLYGLTIHPLLFIRVWTTFLYSLPTLNCYPPHQRNLSKILTYT